MQLEMILSMPRDARFVTVLRNVATCMLQGSSAPPEAVQDVEIALSEACTNVVRHASGTDEYSVCLRVDASGCVIEVTDLGPGFSALQMAPDEQPVVEDAEAGRGLYLMKALVDELRFSRTGSEMKVQFTKSWPSLEGVQAGST